MSQPEDLTKSFGDALEEVGDFGTYQVQVFSLIAVGIVWHALGHCSFVFSAKNIDYR